MYQIPFEFKKFIELECDRTSFIQSYLNKSGIDAPVIQMNEKKHIYVKFPMRCYNPEFRIKTVIAHYDRVENTPGANDNSAAVWCMLEWCRRLVQMKDFHNIRLIFTDGEELGKDEVGSQGAFPLAALFRKLGITDDDIYVFDCMGRGEVPVLTQTVLPHGVSQKFKKKFAALEERTVKLIQSAGQGKWFSLPCNYSDNASFIANGIPAVAITMLPSSEISDAIKGKIPYTWRLFHTMKDDFESLMPQSFIITSRILDMLALMKSL